MSNVKLEELEVQLQRLPPALTMYYEEHYQRPPESLSPFQQWHFSRSQPRHRSSSNLDHANYYGSNNYGNRIPVLGLPSQFTQQTSQDYSRQHSNSDQRDKLLRQGNWRDEQAQHHHPTYLRQEWRHRHQPPTRSDKQRMEHVKRNNTFPGKSSQSKCSTKDEGKSKKTRRTLIEISRDHCIKNNDLCYRNNNLSRLSIKNDIKLSNLVDLTDRNHKSRIANSSTNSSLKKNCAIPNSYFSPKKNSTLALEKILSATSETMFPCKDSSDIPIINVNSNKEVNSVMSEQNCVVYIDPQEIVVTVKCDNSASRKIVSKVFEPGNPLKTSIYDNSVWKDCSVSIDPRNVPETTANLISMSTSNLYEILGDEKISNCAFPNPPSESSERLYLSSSSEEEDDYIRRFNINNSETNKTKERTKELFEDGAYQSSNEYPLIFNNKSLVGNNKSEYRNQPIIFEDNKKFLESVPTNVKVVSHKKRNVSDKSFTSSATDSSLFFVKSKLCSKNIVSSVERDFNCGITLSGTFGQGIQNICDKPSCAWIFASENLFGCPTITLFSGLPEWVLKQLFLLPSMFHPSLDRKFLITNRLSSERVMERILSNFKKQKNGIMAILKTTEATVYDCLRKCYSLNPLPSITSSKLKELSDQSPERKSVPAVTSKITLEMLGNLLKDKKTVNLINTIPKELKHKLTETWKESGTNFQSLSEHDLESTTKKNSLGTNVEVHRNDEYILRPLSLTSSQANKKPYNSINNAPLKTVSHVKSQKPLGTFDLVGTIISQSQQLVKDPVHKSVPAPVQNNCPRPPRSLMMKKNYCNEYSAPTGPLDTSCASMKSKLPVVQSDIQISENSKKRAISISLKDNNNSFCNKRSNLVPTQNSHGSDPLNHGKNLRIKQHINLSPEPILQKGNPMNRPGSQQYKNWYQNIRPKTTSSSSVVSDDHIKNVEKKFNSESQLQIQGVFTESQVPVGKYSRQDLTGRKYDVCVSKNDNQVTSINKDSDISDRLKAHRKRFLTTPYEPPQVPNISQVNPSQNTVNPRKRHGSNPDNVHLFLKKPMWRKSLEIPIMNDNPKSKASSGLTKCQNTPSISDRIYPEIDSIVLGSEKRRKYSKRNCKEFSYEITGKLPFCYKTESDLELRSIELYVPEAEWVVDICAPHISSDPVFISRYKINPIILRKNKKGYEAKTIKEKRQKLKINGKKQNESINCPTTKSISTCTNGSVSDNNLEITLQHPRSSNQNVIVTPPIFINVTPTVEMHTITATTVLQEIPEDIVVNELSNSGLDSLSSGNAVSNNESGVVENCTGDIEEVSGKICVIDSCVSLTNAENWFETIPNPEENIEILRVQAEQEIHDMTLVESDAKALALDANLQVRRQRAVCSLLDIVVAVQKSGTPAAVPDINIEQVNQFIWDVLDEFNKCLHSEDTVENIQKQLEVHKKLICVYNILKTSPQVHSKVLKQVETLIKINHSNAIKSLEQKKMSPSSTVCLMNPPESTGLIPYRPEKVGSSTGIILQPSEKSQNRLFPCLSIPPSVDSPEAAPLCSFISEPDHVTQLDKLFSSAWGPTSNIQTLEIFASTTQFCQQLYDVVIKNHCGISGPSFLPNQGPLTSAPASTSITPKIGDPNETLISATSSALVSTLKPCTNSHKPTRDTVIIHNISTVEQQKLTSERLVSVPRDSQASSDLTVQKNQKESVLQHDCIKATSAVLQNIASKQEQILTKCQYTAKIPMKFLVSKKPPDHSNPTAKNLMPKGERVRLDCRYATANSTTTTSEELKGTVPSTIITISKHNAVLQNTPLQNAPNSNSVPFSPQQALPICNKSIQNQPHNTNNINNIVNQLPETSLQCTLGPLPFQASQLQYQAHEQLRVPQQLSLKILQKELPPTHHPPNLQIPPAKPLQDYEIQLQERLRQLQEQHIIQEKRQLNNYLPIAPEKTTSLASQIPSTNSSASYLQPHRVQTQAPQQRIAQIQSHQSRIPLLLQTAELQNSRNEFTNTLVQKQDYATCVTTNSSKNVTSQASGLQRLLMSTPTVSQLQQQQWSHQQFQQTAGCSQQQQSHQRLYQQFPPDFGQSQSGVHYHSQPGYTPSRLPAPASNACTQALIAQRHAQQQYQVAHSSWPGADNRSAATIPSPSTGIHFPRHSTPQSTVVPSVAFRPPATQTPMPVWHKPQQQNQDPLQYPSVFPNTIGQFGLNPVCDNKCGRPATLICKGCRTAYYCTVECSTIHWNLVHGVECPRLDVAPCTITPERL